MHRVIVLTLTEGVHTQKNAERSLKNIDFIWLFKAYIVNKLNSSLIQ